MTSKRDELVKLFLEDGLPREKAEEAADIALGDGWGDVVWPPLGADTAGEPGARQRGGAGQVAPPSG